MSPTSTVITKYLITLLSSITLYFRISMNKEFSYVRIAGLLLLIIVLTIDSISKMGIAKKLEYLENLGSNERGNS